MAKHTPDFQSLFKDYQHPNPYINDNACLKISEYWPEQLMTMLLANLAESNVSERRKAVRGLTLLGYKSFTPVVNTFLDNSNQIVRICCLKVLVKLAALDNIDTNNSELKKIIKVSMMDDSAEMILVLNCLLRQMGEIGKEILLQFSRDNNVLRSISAISALSEIKDKRVNAILSELSNDMSLDSMIRDRAYEALNAQY